MKMHSIWLRLDSCHSITVTILVSWIHSICQVGSLSRTPIYFRINSPTWRVGRYEYRFSTTNHTPCGRKSWEWSALFVTFLWNEETYFLFFFLSAGWSRQCRSTWFRPRKYDVYWWHRIHSDFSVLWFIQLHVGCFNRSHKINFVNFPNYSSIIWIPYILLYSYLLHVLLLEEADEWGVVQENMTGNGIMGAIAERRVEAGIAALFHWYEI